MRGPHNLKSRCVSTLAGFFKSTKIYNMKQTLSKLSPADLWAMVTHLRNQYNFLDKKHKALYKLLMDEFKAREDLIINKMT